MNTLASFVRRLADPADLGQALTEPLRAAARAALLADGHQLPLGSVTAPPTEDSAHFNHAHAPLREAWAPLTLLAHETRPIPALLLFSFYGSHRDFLDRPGFTFRTVDRQNVAVSHFVHRASKRHYEVTCAELPSSQQAARAPTSGQCALCAGVADMSNGCCQRCSGNLVAWLEATS